VSGARNAGVYTAQWTPSGDGVFLLTAAYPAAGGPSSTVHLTVDATPPTFMVTVPPADAGVPDGGTTYEDPGLVNAWRRDQVVPVEIRTNEPNLDLSTLTVALQGTDGGVAPAVGVTPLTSPCDAGFCGVAQLKLWEPPFNAFRGTMTVDVRGADKVGNTGSASSSVNVTRWKWVFDGAAGAIKSAPGIGAMGTVYLGTNANTTGKVFALTPEGTLKWESQVGAVVGGPVVGASDGGTELVYVGANSASNGTLYALQSEDGGTPQACPMADGVFEGSLALGNIAQVETAVSVYTGSTGPVIAGISPGAGVSCPVVESPASGEQIPSLISGSPVVMRDDNIFFSGAESGVFKVTSYAFGVSTPRTNWPVTAPTVPRSLALVGSDVISVAASLESVTGGVFKVPQGGAPDVTRLYPAGSTWSSRVFSLAVGSADNAFFGSESTSAVELNRLDLTTVAAQAATTSPAIRATPVAGQNGTVYTVTTNGIVRAWAADDLSARWTLAPALGTVEASPTLDCPRNATGALVEGNHGVLYVPAGGKLHALIVDSRGLDPTAPWPKYQHDVRNTGNPDTPIPSCQ
jgi:PQQ-like domain